jgi:hypothetical protein
LHDYNSEATVMIAQGLALDFSEHRIWAIQAAGLGVAALVLMVGRFITAANRRRPVATSAAKMPAPGSARRPPDSCGHGAEITLRVEDAWK